DRSRMISARCRSRTAILVARIRRCSSCLSAASSAILPRTIDPHPSKVGAANTDSASKLSSYLRSTTLAYAVAPETFADFVDLVARSHVPVLPPRGAEGSNPAHSTGESATNCTGGGLRWSPAAIHAHHYVPKDWMTRLKAETFAKCKMQAEFATEVRRRGRMDRRLRSSLPGG